MIQSPNQRKGNVAYLLALKKGQETCPQRNPLGQKAAALQHKKQVR